MTLCYYNRCNNVAKNNSRYCGPCDHKKYKKEEKLKVVNVPEKATSNSSSIELSAIININYSKLDNNKKLIAAYKLPILQYIKKMNRTFEIATNRSGLSINNCQLLNTLEVSN